MRISAVQDALPIPTQLTCVNYIRQINFPLISSRFRKERYIIQWKQFHDFSVNPAEIYLFKLLYLNYSKRLQILGKVSLKRPLVPQVLRESFVLLFKLG